jgi:cytochrome c oxidase cbb3-type subunit 3
MSDFVSDFWGVLIALISIVSVVSCGLLLKVQSVVKRGSAPVETTGHVWDGDLQELNNPLPRWWSWLFYLTVIFALAYLLLYPGLGKFGGYLGWSQVAQYEDERSAAEKQFGPLYDKFLKQDIKAVAADPQARAMGLRIFLNNCAQCHGSDAGGAKGFPNLHDNDWLYGGEPAQIETSITEGRDGIMPPFGPALGDEGVKNVVSYVRSLSGLPVEAQRVAAGKEIFATNCAACHGADAKGNQMIGAPNLSDAIWLYGSSEKTVIETVTKGRGGNSMVAGQTRMPAHKELLSEAKIHLVAAYVWGLSHPEVTGAAPTAK